MSSYELITDPAENRLIIKPYKYPHLMELFRQSEAVNWVDLEIPFSQDKIDWDTKLNDDEKHFLELNFAFFSVFDQLVIDNIEDFTKHITIPEAKRFYNRQKVMEDVHVLTYQDFPLNLVDSKERIEFILNATTTVPVIGKMKDFVLKNSTTIPRRLVLFIAIEGILFIGSFASIFYFKTFKSGLMPGLIMANEFIARDEGLHTTFGIEMYKLVINKLPEEEVVELIKETVDLAVEFITVAIPVDLIGINSQEMIKYIKFTADQIAMKVIEKTIYNTENPFHWMETINLESKTNFFDKRVTQYSRPLTSENNDVSFNVDF